MKNNNKQSQGEEDALQIFNDVKDSYAQKIEELNELKKDVFRTDAVDQQQKSKLRITIESLLIDLNEEIFSISEELAKSYTFERQKNLIQKAKEFDQRKKAMLKKIKDSIDDSSGVKLVRRSIKIHNNSPPQKDSSRFGNTQGSNSKPIQDSPKNSSQQINRQYKQELSEIFNQDKYPQSQRQEPTQVQALASRQRSSQKQKSPTPLRRKDFQNNSFTHERKKSSSKSRQSSAKKQLFSNVNETKDSRDGGSKKPVSKTRKKSRKLDEFEKYLEIKKGKENSKPYQSVQQPAPLQNQENNLHQSSTILQSEAFEQFAQDFAHMKNKVLQLQNKFNESDSRTKSLEDDVEKLKTENIKLTTDCKIIRGEHSEILHTLYQLEKKNNQLVQENQVLKRLIQGERELKGQESNLPRPYIEPQISATETSFQQEQKQSRSPFSSVLQKNRSFNQLRDAKDTQSLQNPLLLNQRDAVTYQDQKYINTQSSLGGTAGMSQLIPEPIQPYQNVRNSQQYQQQLGFLSSSRERQQIQLINQSYQNQPNQQLLGGPSRQASGPQSRGEFGRIQDTPHTPDDRNLVTDETPSQFKRDEGGSRQRSFLQNKKTTPNQSQVIMENSQQLSDWVLDRINNKKQVY